MREQRKFICLAEREQVREIKVVISLVAINGKCEILPIFRGGLCEIHA